MRQKTQMGQVLAASLLMIGAVLIVLWIISKMI